MIFRVVIPARYESSRLPGKPLLEIAGRPLIEHAWRSAIEAGAESVHVATDDERIHAACEAFGADAFMTRDSHTTGSDRIAELVENMAWDDRSIVVNLQADEPLLPPALVRQVAETLDADELADIATLCTPVESNEAFQDSNVVKVVCDSNGRALYFSRAPIPYCRESANLEFRAAYRHIGLYAYRVSALRALAHSDACELEATERLEQLRAMWIGQRIAVAEAVELPGPGVDTREDLARVRDLMAPGN